MLKRLAAIFLFSTLLIGSGCIFKEEKPKKDPFDIVELTYYKMFDDEDVMQPFIDEYLKSHPNLRISYKKFNDLNEYYDLIVDELAEGEGPDIFSVQNHWFLKNRKKLNPADVALAPPDIFRERFVDVTDKDLIWPDENGVERVYGVPLTVDTLAIYYNKDHFEDRVPERGKPASTWAGIKEDVFKLSKEDNSFERFQVAGMALGRSDNVSRAFDTLLSILMQYEAPFYNETYSQVEFGPNAADALSLYTSFADQDQKNYSWNQYLADARSDEKELSAFARGKVSMIIGYSYLYDEILRQIEVENAKGFDVIDKKAVQVAHMPQLEDPETSADKRVTYASYFAETVSRTSKHPDEAWDFLFYLVGKQNMQKYFEATNKPTSRRDMIPDQRKEPIFGVFVDQVGFAESIPMVSYERTKEIIEKAIRSNLQGTSPNDAMKIAETELESLLPKGGLLPPRRSEG